MNREHLISLDGFRELARPTSAHVDAKEIDKYIEECEDVYIIPAVGLEVFKRLTGDIEREMPEHTLLNGGEWMDEPCGCGDGVLKKCHGLRKALAYFVYARMIQNDGSIMTRTGLMQHNDEYASRSDDRNRVRKYDEVMNVAEMYLSSSLAYLRHMTKSCKVGKVRGTRLTIHAIGD